jgi:hypothetical protein
MPLAILAANFGDLVNAWWTKSPSFSAPTAAQAHRISDHLAPAQLWQLGTAAGEGAELGRGCGQRPSATASLPLRIALGDAMGRASCGRSWRGIGGGRVQPARGAPAAGSRLARRRRSVLPSGRWLRPWLWAVAAQRRALCNARRPMRRLAGPFLVAVVLVGCGGSSHRANAATGCKGLPTARRSMSFLTLFGALDRLSQAQVCARFGAPEKITQARDGRVTWLYGSSRITFKGRRIVAGAVFERGSRNSTYSVSQSLSFNAR